MTDARFIIERPIAHRGLHDGNLTVPENTLAAFLAAEKRDYAIELDVQLSSDGVPVVFHDRDLKRLCGRSEFVSELTADQLAQIRIGETDERILSLKTVLDTLNAASVVIVEMKDNGERNGNFGQAVSEVIAKAEQPMAAMSFAHDLVSSFIKSDSGTPCGLTAEGTSDEALQKHHAFMATPEGQKVAFISYNVSHLPNEFVHQMRAEKGLPIITWTVRNAEIRTHSDQYAEQITFEGFLP
ncbi:MAG: glycerophosphodiester phosphodiesterase family protein [Pseudomonadota bacterium]